MEMNHTQEHVKNKHVLINKSIGCTVSECKYHAEHADFCTLDHIEVVKHEGKADSIACTDCGSFEPKKVH